MIINRMHCLGIYIAVFVLFFSKIFFDCKKDITQIIQKQAIEKNLLGGIDRNKKILLSVVQHQQKTLQQVDNKLLDTAVVLEYLTHFFALQNMTMTKAQLLKIRMITGLNALPVKVNVVGNFHDFSKLLTNFNSGSRPIVANDFSLQLGRNGVMAADLQLFVFA